MSHKVWGPGVWREFNRVEEGDLPTVGERHLSVPRVRAALHHRLSDEIMGAQVGDRVRDLLGHRRHRGRSNRDRRMDE